MVVLKHLVGYMAGHSDQYVSLKWKGMHSGLLRDKECVIHLFWKSSVTQTGLQTETHADLFLAVQSSMVDALSTRLQRLRR